MDENRFSIEVPTNLHRMSDFDAIIEEYKYNQLLPVDFIPNFEDVKRNEGSNEYNVVLNFELKRIFIIPSKIGMSFVNALKFAKNKIVEHKDRLCYIQTIC